MGIFSILNIRNITDLNCSLIREYGLNCVLTKIFLEDWENE